MATLPLPQGAWDCHTHIYGPWDRYPVAADAAYQPAAAPFAALLQAHEQLGIAHGVLVQAACYGSDHGALLAALASGAGRYCGVALVDADTADAELQALDAAGVRGARLNFVGHLPGERDPARLRRLAERLRPLGWHLLLHGTPAELLPALDLLADSGLPLVIDHMARLDATGVIDELALARLEAHLRRPHCWIKLSGADRVTGGAPAPWPAALPLARRLLRCAPERAIWGSDWPHPNIQGQPPGDSDLLQFVLEVCGDAATARAVLVDNPARLYRLPAARSLTSCAR